MGILNMFKEALFFDDDDIDEEEIDDEYERTNRKSLFRKKEEPVYDEYDEEPVPERVPRKRVERSESSTRTRNSSSQRRPRSINGPSRVDRRPISSYSRNNTGITIIKATDLSDAQVVCDKLNSGNPIVVKFEDPSSPNAQRIMDFISGCIYSINGNLISVDRNTFIFAPDGVDIDGDMVNKFKNQNFGVPTFNKMF